MKNKLLAALSRRLISPPAKRTTDYDAYSAWRLESLQASWSAFNDQWITGKDVLDFGCGDGQMSLFLANKHPTSIVGVDLSAEAIARASKNACHPIRFLVGDQNCIPVPNESMDTLLAFDCMEHVMSPREILAEWHRILRPGGKCLIEWFPFKGPWGPHMESLIPIPWAHMLFGEQAMFQAAAEIYDHPDFQPRHWDLDENGRKKPNKWRAWSTFAEQGFINELDIQTFKNLAIEAGFHIDRLDLRGLSGPPWRRAVGAALIRLPFVWEYFVISAVIELRKL